MGSETLLARMIENLIENAIRHNKDQGSVDVTLILDATKACLVIDSDGDALDERAVARFAQPFKRLGQDRTGSQNGHGLGLSIVAAIAAATTARSSRIPAGKAGCVSGSRCPARQLLSRLKLPHESPRRRGRAGIRNAIAKGLRDQAMAVDVAYDGHDAAAKFDLNPYDVVVLDRDLPGIHGDTHTESRSRAGPNVRARGLARRDATHPRFATCATGPGGGPIGVSDRSEEPCFSAEGGAGASWIRANSDRPLGRNPVAPGRLGDVYPMPMHRRCPRRQQRRRPPLLDRRR